MAVARGMTFAQIINNTLARALRIREGVTS
jgi:hypothetical protein